MAEGEAAFGVVELQRRDAEVGKDALHFSDTELTYPALRSGEGRVDELDAPAPFRQSPPRFGERRGVAVDRYEARFRAGRQQRGGMPSEAERAVDPGAPPARAGARRSTVSVKRTGRCTAFRG